MLNLKVYNRDTGTTKAKKIRKEGKIPGVLYGPRIRPLAVAVEYKDFARVYGEAGESSLISLQLNGEGTGSVDSGDNVVLIREAKVNPVSRDFLHVDFYQLPLDSEIEITIPVRGENEAPAVKTEGGVLVQNLHEIDIKALPTKLIHEVVVDLSSLEHLEDSILVEQLSLGSDIEILAEPDTTLFTVETPREEEEPEEETGEEGEDEQISDIKTEAEEKREEEEKEEAETGA